MAAPKSRVPGRRTTRPPPEKPSAHAAQSIIDLTSPERLADFAYLACFRGRKYSRASFARLVQDRIGASERTERLILHLPVELLALFMSREVRPVDDDRAPMNEWFELPDGGMLEFVGDHMEAADTVARLLLMHDETRLEHVVELITNHDRSWLHTLALEARDTRLMDLGFVDLDDVDRLFTPWHAILLIRKLQAAVRHRSVEPRVLRAGHKVGSADITTYVRSLREPARRATLDRIGFLALCQAVHDAKRKIRRLVHADINRSISKALRVLAQGIQSAGGDLSLLVGPQMGTVYRLGLAVARSKAPIVLPPVT